MTIPRPSLSPNARPLRPLWVVGKSLSVTLITLALSVYFQSAVFWLIVPLLILLAGREQLDGYGLILQFTPPSYACHLYLGMSALVIYLLGYLLVVFFVLDQSINFHLPSDAGSLLFVQFFAIALPEEFFFRGYLQTRMNQVLGAPWRLAGAQVGSGLLWQAGVFALCHFTVGNWTPLQVFFFALLAGWLRERSGSIVGPAVYHALGNVWVLLWHV
jgi:membrane protease YdiL (CAAX protease family)